MYEPDLANQPPTQLATEVRFDICSTAREYAALYTSLSETSVALPVLKTKKSSFDNMRILWLSHLIPFPPKGGVQQRSYNLIRELSRHHEVILLAFNQRAHLSTPAALKEAVDHFSEFCTVDKVLCIRSDIQRFGKHRLAIRSLLGNQPYTIRWLDSDEYEKAVSEAIAKYAPDAMHLDTISLARYYSATNRIPAALNHHNIESDMLLRRASLESNAAAKLYYWQEGSRLRRYEHQQASKFKAHLTCSGLDANRLKAIAGHELNTVVIPNGVDLSYFSPTGQLLEKANSIVFAGRLSWYPNAIAMRFFVQEIWPLLKLRKPDVAATIIGKSPPAELTAAAAKDGQITVTGFVDDVRPYLERASVYICPIFDGGGTKLKILDALAMGCAIVAHPIACEGIEVTDGKDVVLASTAQEFADATVRLFEDAELRANLSRNARKLAESTYSFVEIGMRLAQCYESMSAPSSRP